MADSDPVRRYKKRVAGIYGPNEAGIGCLELTAADRGDTHNYAVADNNLLAAAPTRMTENRFARIWRALEPAIFAAIVNLDQVHVAMIMPTAYQINITVLVTERDRVVDRDRHPGQSLILPAFRVQAMNCVQ